jgi:hypothetical protein
MTRNSFLDSPCSNPARSDIPPLVDRYNWASVGGSKKYGARTNASYAYTRVGRKYDTLKNTLKPARKIGLPA